MQTIMGFNAYDAVPEWASFLTLDEFRAFLSAIAEDLRSRGLLFQDNNGLLEVACPDGRIARCGLANIALRCGAAGRDGFAREVAKHFDRIFGPMEPPPPFPASFEEVRSIIRVRVYTEDYLSKSDAKVIARPLAAGLTSVAVYDMPSFCASVSPEHIEAWKVSPDEVLRAGIANVSREKVERDPLRMGEVELFGLIDASGYAASQIHHIESYVGSSKLGAIVAMPHRHILICYPIKLPTVFEALRGLVPLVEGIYGEPPRGDGRGLLTTQLYWWRRGKLVCLPAGMDMFGLPGVVIAPPQEFIDGVLGKAGYDRN